MVRKFYLELRKSKRNKERGVRPRRAYSPFCLGQKADPKEEQNMKSKMFEKETFKKDVTESVKNLFRKTLDEATEQEIFQAVSYVVKDVIIDEWLATQHAFDREDPKFVYYMSMEFLMGRALGNNLINLTAYEEVREALAEMGLNLDAIEDQEPDPALGERRSWKTCGMLYGVPRDSGISGIWLRDPLPLWYV